MNEILYSFQEIIHKKRVLEERFNQSLGLNNKRNKGCYYTPDFIVQYMLEKVFTISLSNKIKGFSPEKSTDGIISKLNRMMDVSLAEELIYHILPTFSLCDISAGWGAFLLQAFEYFFNLYKISYEYLSKESSKPDLFPSSLYLNLDHFIICQIFTRNIYGSDLSTEAIELAEANLIEKAFQYIGKNEMSLPQLNLVSGNSLVGVSEFKQGNNKLEYTNKFLSKLTEKERISVESWFNKQPKIHWNSLYPAILSTEGFDIIIGNPPYVNTKRLDVSERRFLSKMFKTYNANGDLSNVFWERSIQLCKINGLVSLITPRYWLEGSDSDSLRKFLLKQSTIREIVDFRSNRTIFTKTESYLGIDTAVTTIEKKTPDKNQFSVYLVIDNKPISSIESGRFRSCIINQSNLNEKKWVFEKSPIIHYLNDVAPYRLGDDKKYQMFEGVCDMGKGCSTGNNRIFRLKKIGESSYVGAEGIKFNIRPFEKECLRQLIKNSDIERFWWKKRDQFWIFLRGKNIDDYPNIKSYLEQFTPILLKTQQKYNLNNFYDYAAYRSLSLINNIPKIISPYQAEKNRFALLLDDNIKSLNETDVITLVIKNKHLQEFSWYYLTAILNSELIQYYTSLMNKKVYNLYDFRSNQMASIPLVKVVNQEIYEKIVNEIILMKRMRDGSSKQNQCEKFVYLLNLLVYETYFRDKLDSTLTDFMVQEIGNLEWLEIFQSKEFEQNSRKIIKLKEIKIIKKELS